MAVQRLEPELSAIPLTRPSTDEDELRALEHVLASGWLAGQGPRGSDLEEAFCELSDRAHAVAVNNCTAGLHLALAALGVEPGDEVLVADYSFPATAHAVLYCGATPRFVDVRPDTGTIDLDSLAARITPRTRGIVGVDALGVPADWPAIEEIARAHGLFTVEDAACSVGGSFGERPCGSFGDIAVFSLHARKGITSGEGGVVVTDDPDLAARIRRTSCFGMSSAFHRQVADTLDIPQFADLGYNYKLSDLLAAVALAQVSKLDSFRTRRTELAATYAALLEVVPLVAAPDIPDDRRPTWQTYAVTLDRRLDRDALVMQLRSAAIGSNIGTYALNRQPVYDATHDCPASDALFERHLALPMYQDLTESDQVRVVETLAELTGRCG